MVVFDLTGKMHVTMPVYKAVDSKIVKWRKYLAQYNKDTGHDFQKLILMRDYINETYYMRCGLIAHPNGM